MGVNHRLSLIAHEFRKIHRIYEIDEIYEQFVMINLNLSNPGVNAHK